MDANLDDLVSEFHTKVLGLLEAMKTLGYEMSPYFTLRTPFEQAKLWKQSRTADEIAAKIAELKAAGAPFLAYCLESVETLPGEHVTNAVPGLSWHQWGEAVDCRWMVDGNPELSTEKLVDGKNGYHVYADVAETIGLTAGGHWPNFKDWDHVQLRSADSPMDSMQLTEIDSVMKQRFGSDPSS